jgi:polar amino acid transport system permease protein
MADLPSTVGQFDLSRANPSAARDRRFFQIHKFPWWLIPLFLLAIWVVYLINTTDTYSNIFNQLQSGITTTLYISVIAYVLSMIFGLLLGIIRANAPTVTSSLVRVISYNVVTLYVETLRGLPILVVLLIVAFVAVPKIIEALAGVGVPITVRDIGMDGRAIIALTMTYSAFMSEVFRAGIQSIERGQRDAARSLGMTYFQLMRFVVLPQAIRRVLPPLGNELIAMVKDSSLVAILGVRDITQQAKLSSSSSFLYLETYLIAATIYLTMTTIGSMVVRFLERRMKFD